MSFTPEEACLAWFQGYIYWYAPRRYVPE